MAWSDLLEGETRERFKRRIESFSDIVFGLSLSQLALQLELPAKASDLVDHPLRFLIFFGTFGIICLTWLSHHRMFLLAFEPEPVDIALNFVYLAFVAILPFAMQINVRFAGTQIGFAIYAGGYAGTAVPMYLLLQRGLNRRSASLSEPQRLELWRAALRNRFVLGASFASLVMIFTVGVAFAWIPFPLVAFAARLIRRGVVSVPARYRPAAA